MESRVGMKVRALKAMLGFKIGTDGYVFEEYQDFDDKTKTGIQVIFSNGSYCGFSADEQSWMLQCLDIDPRFSTYEFENVNQVYKDYRNGYWKFYGD